MTKRYIEKKANIHMHNSMNGISAVDFMLLEFTILIPNQYKGKTLFLFRKTEKVTHKENAEECL